MIYEKWRELNINPFDIKFNNIKIKEIISYPPAGNDVVECVCDVNSKLENVYIKIERSKVCDFVTEVKHLNYLLNNNIYLKVPKVYESGIFNEKNYMVLSKIDGIRLSDIINKGVDLKTKNSLLYKYGKELSLIHNIPSNKFEIAKQRIINSYPKSDIYKDLNNAKELEKYINYLHENEPKIKFDTFIHGDFHYGNILWRNNEINGVIDWEYSGKGFKEQDIAWACILRPGQKFMDNIDDIKCFLDGYLEKGNFDIGLFRWCLINGYCHFYLMNISNEDYKKKVFELLEIIKDFKM